MPTVAGRPVADPERFDVVVELGVRVPVRDGLELSANLWRPSDAGDPDHRFPALLEMIPYGKDSWRRNADVARGEWFASRGIALCRLDVRGTGSSPGIAVDEYAADETRDGADAVEWLAARGWCNGRVGMWGISYGGFTAIQVAALRPPHLAAIVPVYATDDRYRDDVHYRGGCLTASELSQYAVSQVAMNAMPPDPAVVGDGWLDAWRERLERTPIWLFEWLRRQTDGPYWRQGSLAPAYDALQVPFLAIGGWNDSYVDPVLRMQERCGVPGQRSIVGPWVHSWPQDTYPGPNLDELHEILAFLERWLVDGGTDGVDDDQPFTWYERDFAPPEPFPAAWPGRWRASDSYPHPATTSRTWHLAADGSLAVRPGPSEGMATLPHRATVGTTGALSWGAGWAPNGLPRDQRPDEARSLVWTSDPLDEGVSVLGFPEVALRVAASMPIATVVCRLMDVAPDGSGCQVSIGALNLTHRHSDVTPEPLEPGRAYDVRVPLRATGYRFATGHRLRLVVASAYWPALWPSPEPGELSIGWGGPDGSRIALPIVPPAGGPGDRRPPRFKLTPPDLRPVGDEREEPPVWRVTEDVLAGTVAVETAEAGTTTLEDGRTLETAERFRLVAADADPAAASLESSVDYRWRERTFETGIRAEATIRSDVEAFALTVDLRVELDGRTIHERHETERIPRHLV